MGLTTCPFCCEAIQEQAILCKHCKSDLRHGISPPASATLPPITPQQPKTTAVSPSSAGTTPATASPTALDTHITPRVPLPVDSDLLAAHIRNLGIAPVHGSFWRVCGWFLLANAATVISLALLSGGALVALTPVVIVAGMTFPFIGLLCSRWLAKRAHHMQAVYPGNYRNAQEQHLYEIVSALSARAGLPHTPEVGIYPSNELNAFATGPSRTRALLAFSTALLDGLDDRAIAAVAAHEIAHVANGDMLLLTIMQGAVNALALLITVPLWCIQAVAFFSDKVSWLMYVLIAIVRFLVTGVLLFLGSLVVMGFSRHREYRADELSARLLDPNAMIDALRLLGQQAPTYPKEQQAYAAFKINGDGGCLFLVSTHPPIEARIRRLESLFAVATPTPAAS